MLSPHQQHHTGISRIVEQSRSPPLSADLLPCQVSSNVTCKRIGFGEDECVVGNCVRTRLQAVARDMGGSEQGGRCRGWRGEHTSVVMEGAREYAEMVSSRLYPDDGLRKLIRNSNVIGAYGTVQFSPLNTSSIELIPPIDRLRLQIRFYFQSVPPILASKIN